MYDFSFDFKNISRELRRSDFYRNSRLAQPAVKSAMVDYAVRTAAGGFNNLVFDTHTKNSKTVYDTALLSQDLVLRKLRKNIKMLTRVKQADRNEMISSLRSLLSDGSAMRIYKLDLRSFYESIDREEIEKALSRDLGFPASSLYVFRSFCYQLTAKQIPGLPRGLSITETLTEYAMRSFDRSVQRLESVYYFGRYVDDIVIITTAKEDKKFFMTQLRALLPKGLSFNQGKCRVIDLDKGMAHKSVAAAPWAVNFDFLGYQFNVSERIEINRFVSRAVRLDISLKKVRRLKTRLILSLRKYAETRNFDDLIDRFKVLTGNYSIQDYDTGIRRKVGVGHSYKLIDKDASVSLTELDAFVCKILNGKQGTLCVSLGQCLSDARRRQLLKFRFSHGFNPEAFHHLHHDRIANAINCWKHA